MRRKEDIPEIPIAPMIDCVFLMLIYFMVTSSLQKSEADLQVPAGATGMAADPLPAVDEQRLGIEPAGNVVWNGANYTMAVSGMAGLQLRLEAFRKTCERAGSTPSVLIEPAAEAPAQAIVTVLDTLTHSGIEMIHFP